MKKTCESLPLESVCVLLAHWALETGRGKKCIAYNLGNIKASPLKDHCYFQTWERLGLATADAYASRSSAKEPCEITNRMPTYALVSFRPFHPACRFLAYEALDAGVRDYVAILKIRFSKAWPAVLSGDPVNFVTELYNHRYFTGDPAIYTRSVVSLWHEYIDKFQEPEAISWEPGPSSFF